MADDGATVSADAPGIMWRRVAALVVDWGASYVIATQFVPGNDSLVTLLVFALEQIALVGTLGYSLGHRLFGLRVTRPDGSPAGPVAALVRTLLLVLVVPALVTADGRGGHDRAAGTVIGRVRRP